MSVQILASLAIPAGMDPEETMQHLQMILRATFERYSSNMRRLPNTPVYLSAEINSAVHQVYQFLPLVKEVVMDEFDFNLHVIVPPEINSNDITLRTSGELKATAFYVSNNSLMCDAVSMASQEPRYDSRLERYIFVDFGPHAPHPLFVQMSRARVDDLPSGLVRVTAKRGDQQDDLFITFLFFVMIADMVSRNCFRYFRVQAFGTKPPE